MARTTVEDCLRQTPNHFELVLGAVMRANKLRKGTAAELDEANDREIVVALREIAAGKVTVDLEQHIIDSLQEADDITSGETSIAPSEEAGAEAVDAEAADDAEASADEDSAADADSAPAEEDAPAADSAAAAEQADKQPDA